MSPKPSRFGLSLRKSSVSSAVLIDICPHVNRAVKTDSVIRRRRRRRGLFVIRWAGKKRAAEKSTSCDNEEAELFHKGGFKGFERSCLWDLSRTSFGRGSCIYYPYREERGMPNSLARYSLVNQL